MADDRAIKQLAALRRASLGVGLLAPVDSLRPDPAEIERRINVFGLEPFLTGAAILIDRNATAIQKTAALVLVEIFCPDIRERLDPALLGAVLHRDDNEVRLWRKAVLSRDGNCCTRCGATKELHAHHIARWADAPHLRIVVDNGVTLCRECHEEEHHPQAEAQTT